MSVVVHRPDLDWSVRPTPPVIVSSPVTSRDPGVEERVPTLIPVTLFFRVHLLFCVSIHVNRKEGRVEGRRERRKSSLVAKRVGPGHLPCVRTRCLGPRRETLEPRLLCQSVGLPSRGKPFPFVRGVYVSRSVPDFPSHLMSLLRLPLLLTRSRSFGAGVARPHATPRPLRPLRVKTLCVRSRSVPFPPRPPVPYKGVRPRSLTGSVGGRTRGRPGPSAAVSEPLPPATPTRPLLGPRRPFLPLSATLGF